MSSTVEDLARFVMLQFRGGPAGGQQILPGSTLREMQRVHWLDLDSEAGWGLGFRIIRQGGKLFLGHGGRVRGHRTEWHMCPADKIGIIVLTNADDSSPYIYVEKAFQWVSPAILHAVTPEPKAAEPDPAWQQYVGKYRNAWGDLQVLLLNGELVMIAPTEPEPAWAMAKLIPVAEHTFRIETKDGFSANGELVIFEVDTAGRVKRVKAAENFCAASRHGCRPVMRGVDLTSAVKS